MKRKLHLLTLLVSIFIILPHPVRSDEVRTFWLEWDDVPSVNSFRINFSFVPESYKDSFEFEWNFFHPYTAIKLYRDGTELCSKVDIEENFLMECNISIDGVGSPITFTLATLLDDGTESPHSPPFTIFPPKINEYGNYIPVADIRPMITKLPLSIKFESTGSYDLDGSIQSYEWNFSDGGVVNGGTVVHTFSQPGTYSVTLKVTDNFSTVGSITKSISVPTSDFDCSISDTDSNQNGIPDCFESSHYDFDTSSVIDGLDLFDHIFQKHGEDAKIFAMHFAKSGWVAPEIIDETDALGGIIEVTNDSSSIKGAKVEVNTDVFESRSLISIGTANENADRFETSKTSAGPVVEINSSLEFNPTNKLYVTIPYDGLENDQLEGDIQIYHASTPGDIFQKYPDGNIVEIDRANNKIRFLAEHFSEFATRHPAPVMVGGKSYSPTEVKMYERGLAVSKGIGEGADLWELLGVGFQLGAGYFKLSSLEDELKPGIEQDVELIVGVGNVDKFIHHMIEIGKIDEELRQKNYEITPLTDYKERINRQFLLLLDLNKDNIQEEIINYSLENNPLVRLGGYAGGDLGGNIVVLALKICWKALWEFWLKTDEIVEGLELISNMFTYMDLTPLANIPSGSLEEIPVGMTTIPFYKTDVYIAGTKATVRYNIFKNNGFDPRKLSIPPEIRQELERNFDIYAPYVLVFYSFDLGKLQVDSHPYAIHPYPDSVYLKLSSNGTDALSNVVDYHSFRRACQGGDCLWISTGSFYKMDEDLSFNFRHPDLGRICHDTSS